MLKHLKIRRQESSALDSSQLESERKHELEKAISSSVSKSKQHLDKEEEEEEVTAATQSNNNNEKLPPRRVRGRRSSKPMMEKRRRARINECLNILKSYVLADSDNLSQLGVDAAVRENQDEETIARIILKSSGLVNRHRGRKNPSKLEKADILELTVDYVRRLHEQRDKQQRAQQQPPSSGNTGGNIYKANSEKEQAVIRLQPMGTQQMSIDTQRPLTLALPLMDRVQANLPPSPAASSVSNSPQPLLSILSTVQYNNQTTTTTTINDALDLSAKVKSGQQVNAIPYRPNNAGNSQTKWPLNSSLLVESADGCWRPWNLAATPNGGLMTQNPNHHQFPQHY